MVGGIYKGRIKNLDPGLKAAFVDIGYNKNAFLHYWDMLPAAADSSVEVVRVNKKKDAAASAPPSPRVKDIPGLYPPGTEIVIQVTKGPIGTKGPRTTTNLSLPGRYLILTPFSDGCGISRKIEDPQERKRLKTLINELTIPEGMGVIVRTAGEGKKTPLLRPRPAPPRSRLDRDSAQDGKRPRSRLPLPGARHRRAHRARLPHRGHRPRAHRQREPTSSARRNSSPRSPPAPRGKIAYYKDSIPVFERYNIERQIEQTFQRHVTLPSGGEIVIDETEALIAIDVNTGSHKSRSGDEKNTIFQVNMEAAVEISRQIRLRNIGGLVIMDFIDMKERRHRNAVYDKMVELMSEDKAKTHILPISQLGIMQMTRQRQQESLSRQPLHRLPVLPRPRHREIGDDDVGRVAAQALLRRPSPPGSQGRQGILAPRARAPLDPRPPARRRCRAPRAHGEALRGQAGLPRRPELPRRELQNHQREHERRVSVKMIDAINYVGRH